MSKPIRNLKPNRDSIRRSSTILSLHDQNNKALQELGIQYKDQEDYNQLIFILSQIVSYPSTQAAIRHEQSDRLGSHDLVQGHNDKFTLDDMHELGKGFKFCYCCGFLLQETSIKMCTRLEDIPNIGISTFLYFRALLSVVYMMVIMLLIYSVFAIGTNLIAGNQSEVESIKNLVMDISLASKQLNATEQNLLFYSIQSWLGVVIIILWGLLLIYLKGKQKRKILGIKQQSDVYEREEEAISAADFSILIQDVPKSIDKAKMQAIFDEYQQKLQQTDGINVQFKIAKFNVGRPFYLNQQKFQSQQLQQINKQYNQKHKQFCKWLLERRNNGSFSQFKVHRNQQYYQFKRLKQNRMITYKEITKMILNQFQAENQKQPTNTVFITFTTNSAKNLIIYLNGYEWTSQIRDKITCWKKNRLEIQNTVGKLSHVRIKPAPQPEDIIWVNLGHSFGKRTKRKFITFLITLLLLVVSFWIVYCLSTIQIKLNKDNNKVVTLLISLVISIFNIIIQLVIRMLTYYQRDYSQNNLQTSLAIKAVLALLTNSILIPILVDYFVKGDIFSNNGLIYDVFSLSVTNALLTPVLKIFDPYYYYTRIMKKIKGRPSSKIYLNQQQLNEYYEGIPFEAGYEYIYIINIYLFTCFFVTLQPVISFIALIGLIAMFWSQKYSLFYRCKRPVPGNNIINTIMFQFIYLGPLFYSIGNFIWQTYFPNTLNRLTQIPTILSFVLSVIIIFFPYQQIFNYLYKDAKDPLQMKYQQNRIYFPSEYDRLNPATSQQAIKQYMQFIKNYRNSIINKSSVEKKKIELGFLKQIAKGCQQKTHFLPHFNQDENSQNVNIIQDIFRSHANMISPILIGASLLPQSQNLRPNLRQSLNQQGNEQIPNQNFDINNILWNRFSKTQAQNNKQFKGPQFDQNSFEKDTLGIFDPSTTFSNIFKLENKNKNQKEKGNFIFDNKIIF